MLRTILFAGITFALSGAMCGGAAASPPADCFRNRDVNAWTVINDNTMRVRISRTRQYDLTTTSGFLRDLRGDLRVALQSGSSRICTGPGFDTEIQQLDQQHQSWSVGTIARVPAPALAPPPPPHEG